MVMSYDYMVLAGNQGIKNHAKKDRMFEIAEQQRLPTVLFAEGGGGRPGDTDGATFAGARLLGIHVLRTAFRPCPHCRRHHRAAVSPAMRVLLACCDVIIATEGSNIGMAARP